MFVAVRFEYFLAVIILFANIFITIVSLLGAGQGAVAALFLTTPASTPAPKKSFRRFRL